MNSLKVDDVVVFDPSEFPFLGFDMAMERERLTVVEIQAERWHGLAQIIVEWNGGHYSLLENAVTLV